MWLESDTCDLDRISQIALRQGVPEIIALLVDSLPAGQCLTQVRPYMDLPSKDEEAMAILVANRSNWEWDPEKRRFRLSAAGDSAK